MPGFLLQCRSREAYNSAQHPAGTTQSDPDGQPTALSNSQERYLNRVTRLARSNDE